MTETIREVEERDVDAVVTLVHELATYERAPEHCTLTTEQLRTAALCAERGLPGSNERSSTGPPSIAFYRSVGGVALDEWTTFRLDGETLAALGHGT